MPGIHVIADTGRQIVDRHFVRGGVRDEQTLVRIVIGNPERCSDARLRIARNSRRKARLSQDIDSILSVRDAIAQVKHRHAVSRVLRDKQIVIRRIIG